MSFWFKECSRFVLTVKRIHAEAECWSCCLLLEDRSLGVLVNQSPMFVVPRQVIFRGFHRMLSTRLPARRIAKHILCVYQMSADIMFDSPCSPPLSSTAQTDVVLAIEELLSTKASRQLRIKHQPLQTPIPPTAPLRGYRGWLHVAGTQFGDIIVEKTLTRLPLPLS